MSAISITKLYDDLAAKLGKENAENLITYFDNKINTDMENKCKILATKDDISRLEKMIYEINIKLGETNSKIGESKGELIQWMVGICVALVAMILGLYFK
jgi:hypothetical protein